MDFILKGRELKRFKMIKLAYKSATSFLVAIVRTTAAVAQLIRAFTSHPEGCLFESKLRQTQVVCC